MALRVAPLPSWTGQDGNVLSGLFSWRQLALIVTLIAALATQARLSTLSSPTATPALALLLLVCGLPHGGLDLGLLRRGSSGWSSRRIVATYLALAGSTYVLWTIGPTWGLALFMAMAVVHFAEDWQDELPPFFAIGTALALLAAPALRHREALVAIFAEVTGATTSSVIVDAATLIAPVSLAAAGVGIAIMGPRSPRALETTVILVGMVALPPLVGFALYFCLSHSPVHFRSAWSALGKGRGVQLIVVTAAALAMAAVVRVAGEWQPLGSSAISAAFVILAMLTVPHMAMPFVVRRTGGGIA